MEMSSLKKIFVTIHILAVAVTIVYFSTYLEDLLPNSTCYRGLSPISRYLHMALGQKYRRSLVYVCENGRACGEWPDRLQGMAMGYMLSKLTKRRFGILSTNPVRLEDMMKPRYVDWTFYQNKEIHGSCAVYDFLSDQKFNEMLQQADLDEMFPEDIVYVRLNRFSWEPLYRNPRYHDQIQKIGKNAARAFFRASHDILRPNEPMDDQLHQYQLDLRRYYSNKLACAIVDAETGIQLDRNSLDTLWAHLGQYKVTTMIVISSSDKKLLDTAANRFGDQFKSVLGVANVFDKPEELQYRKVNNMRQSILDFYVLVHCDEIILSCGNTFGSLVAFIRNSDENLFYLHKEKLTKTSLETLGIDHTNRICSV